MRVFIGFDERQPIAYNVASLSMAVKASRPVSITPLIYRQIPLKRTGLTKFTFTRYMVPFLCGYEGAALFVDGDVLCRGDVADLPWNSEHAVSVVPHDTVEKEGQRVSVRFERPSVMLFNCAKCRKLTPDYIETGAPQSFEWAESVGELPKAWNHLVGYDSPQDAKLVHFTQGIPCFPETQNDEYAKEWQEIAQMSCSTVSWDEIMGPSVHAQWKKRA